MRARQHTDIAAVETAAAVALAAAAWGLLMATWLQLFAETGWPPHRAVTSASAATLLAALAAVASAPAARRLRAGGLLLIAATLLTLLDRLAWRHYQDVVSVADWPVASNLLPVAASATAIATPQDGWLLLPAAVGFVALVRRSRATAAAGRHPAAAWIAAASGVLAAVPAVSLVARDPDGVFEFAFQRRELVDSLGLPGYHAYDLFDQAARTAGRWRAQRAAQAEPADDGIRPLTRHPLWGAAAGANLILVSLESAQQFVVDLTLDGQMVAPHLSALSRESLAFTRTLDQTHRGSTADAEWLAMQSLYPLEAGAVASRVGGLDTRALPAVLAAEGYATRSAAAQPAGYWNMGRFHSRLGFAESWFADRFEPMPWIGIGGADVRFFDVMASSLGSLPEPFLAYLLTSSSHHPFELPPGEHHLRLGPLRGTTLGNYLQSVHYADRALGGFLERLRRSGQLERSLLVVYGDHSAALDLTAAEQTLLTKDLPALRTADPRFRRWYLRSQVPLLMRLPAATVTGERDRPTGLVDLAPSVLALLGVPSHAAVWLGRDVLDDSTRRSVLTRSGTLADDAGILLRSAGDQCFTWSGHAASCERFGRDRAQARRTLQYSDALVAANRIAAAGRTKQTQARQRHTQPVLVIAHRGASARFPENTAAAIGAAFDERADIVEVDVRRTRDGHAVLFHDDDLARTAGRPGRVEDLTLDEFRRLDVGRWFGARFRGMPPLTLVEALRLAHGRGGVLLDLKADGLAPLVADAVRQTAFPRRHLLIGAWTSSQRLEFRRHLPGARLLKTEGPPAHLADDAWRAARREGAWGWEFDAAAPASFLAALKSSGLVPIGYTVNDDATMRTLIAAGIGGIETDDPALLRAVVDSLGAGTSAGRALTDRW